MEIDPSGKLMWELDNVMEEGEYAGKVGGIQMATRWNSKIEPDTVRSWAASCNDG